MSFGGGVTRAGSLMPALHRSHGELQNFRRLQTMRTL